VIGDVAAALHGSPVMLGARTLHVVPAETALRRIEQTARRLDAQPSAEGTAQTQRWTLPTGGELRVTPLPPGTRGYHDLARDAETMQIAPMARQATCPHRLIDPARLDVEIPAACSGRRSRSSANVAGGFAVDGPSIAYP
jgi:hypothetical protein